jgi:hypothetical protein
MMVTLPPARPTMIPILQTWKKRPADLPGQLCRPPCTTPARALEAVGLAPEGGGGRYVERAYKAAASGDGGAAARAGGEGQHGLQALPPQDFPINTHGGLLGLGAPWEVRPAFLHQSPFAAAGSTPFVLDHRSVSPPLTANGLHTCH